MGIDLQSLRFLLRARLNGVSFSSCLTLGRQDLLLTSSSLQAAFAAVGSEISLEIAESVICGHDRFADGLFALLGSRSADSLDASSFEGASIIHDLNTAVPDTLRDRFTVVFDGGTLEHVFDFSGAIKNCLRMVAPGGHYIAVSPSNSFMGHGFYQFSPELYFRLLCPANGFRIKEVVTCRAFGDFEWFRVADPALVKSRVCQNGPLPLCVMVCAQRIGDTLDFSTPQQSDYAAEWSTQPSKGGNTSRLQFFDDSVQRARPTIRTRVIRYIVPRSLASRLSLIKQAIAMTAAPDERHFQRISWNKIDHSK